MAPSPNALSTPKRFRIGLFKVGASSASATNGRIGTDESSSYDEPTMTFSTAFAHLCGETSRSIRVATALPYPLASLFALFLARAGQGRAHIRHLAPRVIHVELLHSDSLVGRVIITLFWRRRHDGFPRCAQAGTTPQSCLSAVAQQTGCDRRIVG
jgi:hypothetical protein